MQILNQQFKSIAAVDPMKMASSACLHVDSLVSILPAVTNSHFMRSEASCFQSDEVLSFSLWAADLLQSTPLDLRACIGDADSAAVNCISILGLTARDASDAITFFEDGDAGRSAEVYFSIEVPVDMEPAECGLAIDNERAAAFWITVIGMEFAVIKGSKCVNSMPLRNQRRYQERLSTGRMICLLKQQLNV